MNNCDFSGYATRNDLACGDGRVIRKNAFSDNDGRTVPLVWNHNHTNPEAVIGHALLENRADGVYAYGTFNDTEEGKRAKMLVQHGDVRSLSIWAKILKQVGSDVIHGDIKELSLVLAGANPGAYVDFVMAHGVDEEDELFASYDENIKYTDYNGVERKETHYFNYNKAEIAEMELSTAGGLSEMIKKITEAQDGPSIMKLFKDIILGSYGVKSPDGKQFIKSDELSKQFSQTEAYSELFMELVTNADAAAEFVNGIVPKNAAKAANNAETPVLPPVA